MYSFVNEANQYLIVKDGSLLTTPMGNTVKTKHGNLANRLAHHLNIFGEDPSNPVSIVAFHYAMIDFFSTMPRDELERSVALGLTIEHDWTFNRPASPDELMKMISLFGDTSEHISKGSKWLSDISRIQLCAVCVVGRYIESVNIPYIIVNILPKSKLEDFSKEISMIYPYVEVSSLLRCFKNFIFYYSIDDNIS